eukprot:2044644-Pleurochrysis_carterae.AAC.1
MLPRRHTSGAACSKASSSRSACMMPLPGTSCTPKLPGLCTKCGGTTYCMSPTACGWRIVSRRNDSAPSRGRRSSCACDAIDVVSTDDVPKDDVPKDVCCPKTPRLCASA